MTGHSLDMIKKAQYRLLKINKGKILTTQIK